MLLNLMWSLSVQMLIPLNALLDYFSIVAIAADYFSHIDFNKLAWLLIFISLPYLI